jgi:hypothetical protein
VIGPIPDTGNPSERPLCNVQKGGYLIAIDELNFGLDFVATYKSDCDRGFHNHRDSNHTELDIERVFRKDGANFGTFLSKAHTEEDYGEYCS